MVVSGLGWSEPVISWAPLASPKMRTGGWS